MIRAILIVFLAGAAFGQPAAPLIFEVASIKPANPDARGTSISVVPGGGLRITNATLKQLVTTAYEIREFQLSGGPGWIGSERYDILAKSERPEGPSDPNQMSDAQRKILRDQMSERLRALLASRFQLVIHRETKELPVYALGVAKNGPKLQESKEGDGANQSMNVNRSPEGAKMTGRRYSMQMLGNTLSNVLGRPVVDRTGLKANYDFQMTWTPDPPPKAPEATNEIPVAADPSGPSLFTAVQDQLGLRLESDKGPVEIIVIDRAERASEN